jgi:hypothetical protein
MYEFKTRTFGRVAVATLLSLGLTAGAVSFASAATHPAKAVSHVSVKAEKTVAFHGVVTALPAGFVTVVNAKGTSETFAITATTKILPAPKKIPATLVVNDRVDVRALASAPLVATSINIHGAKK